MHSFLFPLHIVLAIGVGTKVGKIKEMGGCPPCKGQNAVMPIECTVSTVKHSTSLLAACSITSSAPILSIKSHNLIHVPVLAIRHSHLYSRRKKNAGKARKSAQLETVRGLSDVRIAV